VHYSKILDIGQSHGIKLRAHTERTLSILGHILGIFAGGCRSGQGIGVEIYDSESQCFFRRH
jgi:hypothetical protein